jgi:hypothetical protein
MPEQPVDDNKASEDQEAREGRRPVLRKLGRFAAVTAPTVALLLAARTKPAKAVTSPAPL